MIVLLVSACDPLSICVHKRMVNGLPTRVRTVLSYTGTGTAVQVLHGRDPGRPWEVRASGAKKKYYNSGI